MNSANTDYCDTSSVFLYWPAGEACDGGGVAEVLGASLVAGTVPVAEVTVVDSWLVCGRQFTLVVAGAALAVGAAGRILL